MPEQPWHSTGIDFVQEAYNEEHLGTVFGRVHLPLQKLFASIDLHN